MALEDIYVLDMKQSFNNEPIHNIFTFERLGEGTAVELINAFQADIYPAISAVQCEQITTDFIKAYSLGNLGDLSEETVSDEGNIEGADMLPVFNAVNFSLKPTGRAVRPGSKRFAGIPESVVTDGQITDSAYIAGLNGIRTAFGLEISVDETNFWRMVIVKRIKYLPEDNPPDKFAYRFPEEGDPLVYAPLRNVTLNLKVSHQTSRGNGR